MKYMGKTTDGFGRPKFWLSQNTVLSQTCTAGRANNIELSMLVLDFVVNFKLKNTHGISVEFMECINKNVRRKNDTFCTVH